MTKGSFLLLLAGCTLVAATTTFMFLRSREHPRTSTAARYVHHATIASRPSVRRAAPAEPGAVDALREALRSSDAPVRIEAVEHAVRTTAIETLPELEKVDLARDADAAPTVIHAVALLGASADDAARDEAAATLARWLREEKQREGVDALGNVSNLVEALGNIGGRDAVDALVTTLERGDVGLEVQTLAVQKLGELGDGRARHAVETFASRAAELPASEGIDEELRVEAIAAAKETLARI